MQVTLKVVRMLAFHPHEVKPSLRFVRVDRETSVWPDQQIRPVRLDNMRIAYNLSIPMVPVSNIK